MPSPDTAAPAGGGREVVVCVDFGSTFTKTSLVDLTDGRIVAAAEHRTTIDTDVLDGYDACLAALAGQDARAVDAATLACSSAGGGLRIAVVGNEELVTAEAGRRVALSSGGKVVAVFAASRGDDLAGLPSCEPDVVLLTGGTDGGNPEPVVACARAEVFILGESLGGVESLIEHPGRMTHASVAGTELEVPSDLIRLSVGIETADDLIADLDRALA